MSIALQHPATGLDFGTIIHALRQGRRARRAGWNGKGMWIALVQVHGFERVSKDWPEDWDNDGDNEQIAPCIVLYTAQRVYQPGWNASTPDLLATDWEVMQHTSHEEG